jgi:hypothetical protein
MAAGRMQNKKARAQRRKGAKAQLTVKKQMKDSEWTRS